MAEVVAVRLHREAIYADGALAFEGGAVGIGAGVVIVPGHLKYLVGNEVFAGAVTLYDGTHHVLRHVGVVGQKLLGVFRQAVATVTE